MVKLIEGEVLSTVGRTIPSAEILNCINRESEPQQAIIAFCFLTVDRI